MDNERVQQVIEELQEVESCGELDALFHDLDQETANAVRAEYEGARARWAGLEVVEDEKAKLQEQIKQLQGKLKALTPAPTSPARVGRKYVLLKTDVSWSSTPQVHALMAILEAHVKVGTEVPESDIIRMMVANEHVLATTQGGKRIWDYYKGNHNKGLGAHGNVKRI